MDTIILAVIAVTIVITVLGYTIRLIMYAMSDESVIDERIRSL